MTTVAEKKALTPEEKVLAKMKNAYAQYAKENAGTNQLMSFADFQKDFSKIQAKKDAEDAVVLSPEVGEFLAIRGWKFAPHTPKSGPNADREGIYAQNPDANAEGTGFIRMSKSRIAKTRERLVLALEAYDLILGHKSLEETVA